MTRNKILLLGFLLLYLGYHLYTLDLYPLPWQDDTTFASMSLSWEKTGKFYCPVAHDARDYKEVLHYGPLYFMLGGTLFKLFGVSIWVFRLLSFAGGLFSAYYLFRLIKAQEQGYIPLLACLIFLIDPFVQLSMHEGRMDLLATGLSLASVFYALQAQQNKKVLLYAALSGTLAALAMLTTPRCVLTLFFLFFVLMSDNLMQRHKSIGAILWWLLAALGLYLIWVFYAFGGLKGMISYYELISSPNSPEAYHPNLGFRPYVPKQEKVLILVAGLYTLIALAIHKWKYFDAFSIVGLFSIVCFFAFFIDWGPYSAYILPFYYYALTRGARMVWEQVNTKALKVAALVPLLLLVLHNMAYTGIKSLFIVVNSEQRSPEKIDAFIAEHIPAGSKVLGYGLHYYSVIKAGSDYQYIDKYNELEVREERQRINYDYDYIIVDGIGLDKLVPTYKYYFEKGQFIRVAEYLTKPSPLAVALSKLNLVSDMEATGYNCVIYARVKLKDKGSLAMSN